MNLGHFTGLTISINLKKTFDTVDHKILFHKLEDYGVVGFNHIFVTGNNIVELMVCIQIQITFI